MTSSMRTVTVEFRGAAQALRSTTRGITNEVGKMGAGVANFGRKLGAFVGGGVQRIARGSLTALRVVGFGLLALPALLLGVVSPATVASFAMTNFAAAVNATSPEAFVAATRNMAPAMKEAVMAVRVLHPELKNLYGSIQQGFWYGFATEITQLAQVYFPILNVELGKVGFSLGRLRSELFQFLLKPETVAAITKMMQAFTGIGPPMLELARSVMPLLVQWFSLWADIMSHYVVPALITATNWVTRLMERTSALTGATGGNGGGSTGGGSGGGIGGFFSNLVNRASSFVAGLFGRAEGGEVLAGRSYLTGERGPEVLTMGGQNGWVSPMSGGGNTYVTVKIGETELREIVTTEVSRIVADAALAARTGRGLLV